MAEPQIALTKVSKRHASGVQALIDVDLAIAAGEFVTLIGPAGAGKTTLLDVIATRTRSSAGIVRIDGEDARRARPRQLALLRRRFGTLFQDHELLCDRSARDNLVFALRICAFSAREAAQRAEAALDRVGLLPRQHALPGELSDGERHMLGLARAIAHRPSVLLLDAPGILRDRTHGRRALDLLGSFNSMGGTVIVATCDAELGAQLAGRCIALQAGRLVEAQEDCTMSVPGSP